EGWGVGGGAELDKCEDIGHASEAERFRTHYSRAWGWYLTGMREYGLGHTSAKEHANTGRPLSGKQAAEVGLINRAVPFADLEGTVMTEARALAALPPAQLAAMKMVVNQAYENMGLAGTQLLGPILDGYMRNIPESLDFIDTAARDGVGAAVAGRDGPWGDYSQAGSEDKPDPANVIAARAFA
ncbi:MAG: enoyl-CoA hydratase, partial [Proteobacteria bacterium]|nr:enoyl-CoA hydratase [Pseudomonadota bacterium]